MTVRVNTASLPYMLLMLSGMLLFLSAWDFDFAVDRTVYLPLLYWEFKMPGWEYAIVSLLTAFSAFLVDALALNMIDGGLNGILPFYTAILVGYAAIIYSYVYILPTSLDRFGEIWNSIFYFFVLPCFIIMNALKVRFLVLEPSTKSGSLGNEHR